MNAMLTADYQDPFRRTYAAALRESIDAAELVQTALDAMLRGLLCEGTAGNAAPRPRRRRSAS